jgi:hypothetical protein
MAATKSSVKKLRKDAEVVGRDLVNTGQNRIRQVTTAALDAAEKMLVAAQHRVHKLRTQVSKPRE